MVMRIVAILTVLVATLLQVRVCADEVSVQLDATTVEQSETFNAEFVYQGKLDGEPQFEVLEKDFQIVSNNRRSNLEITNGNYRYELSWVLTLLPKRIGKLVFPAVQFDKIATTAKTIDVTAATTNAQGDLGDIFLETELTPQDGFVQGQFLFTVRIYFRGWLVDGELSDPDIGGQDVVVQALGDPRRYSRFRNGERYQVYERRHALFPQASGTLSIAPTYFSGRLRLPSGRNLLKRITAEATSAAVKPAPPTFGGALWLPAESVEIEEVWPADTEVFEQGVPITRTLIIRATGLSSAQLPQLEFPPAGGVRMYPDQPTTEDRLVDSGVMGVRTESVALVPQQAGELTLPEVTLVWWDTVNNREQVARVPARTINISPSALAQSQSDKPDIDTMATGTAPAMQAQPLANPWLWATLVCAGGWLLTLWRRPGEPPGTRTQAPGDDTDSKRRRQELRTRLRLACRDNDAGECRVLCYRYLGELPDAGPGSGNEPGTPLSIKLIEQQYGPELAAAVTELSRQLYGRGAGGDWRGGGRLWELLVQAEKQRERSPAPVPSVLQPL